MELHYRNLLSTKSGLAHKGRAPLKPLSLQNDNKYARLRSAEISKTNGKIVETITRIESSKGSYNPATIQNASYRPPKSNKAFHQLEKLKHISAENQKIMGRLQRANSHYSVNKWREEERKNAKLVSNICQNGRKLNPFLENSVLSRPQTDKGNAFPDC